MQQTGTRQGKSDLAGRHNLATFVEAAMRAGMMRTHHFTAIRAFTHSWNANCIVGTAHLALGYTGFSLWNCHINLLCSQPAQHTSYWGYCTQVQPPYSACQSIAKGRGIMVMQPSGSSSRTTPAKLTRNKRTCGPETKHAHRPCLREQSREASLN